MWKIEHILFVAISAYYKSHSSTENPLVTLSHHSYLCPISIFLWWSDDIFFRFLDGLKWNDPLNKIISPVLLLLEPFYSYKTPCNHLKKLFCYNFPFFCHDFFLLLPWIDYDKTIGIKSIWVTTVKSSRCNCARYLNSEQQVFFLWY